MLGTKSGSIIRIKLASLYLGTLTGVSPDGTLVQQDCLWIIDISAGIQGHFRIFSQTKFCRLASGTPRLHLIGMEARSWATSGSIARTMGLLPEAWRYDFYQLSLASASGGRTKAKGGCSQVHRYMELFPGL